jgi:hypothetical protein
MGLQRASVAPSIIAQLGRMVGNEGVLAYIARSQDERSIAVPSSVTRVSCRIQREPTTKVQSDIEKVFAGWSYPIGSSEEKLAGGTGNYDVGAKVYGAQGNELGAGTYLADSHAEINALENVLAANHGLGAVAKIRVTKGCCRRCAVVLQVLGLDNKVGPNTSSPCTGAYAIPPRIRAQIASKLTKFKEDDFCWVISNGTWW